MKVFDLLHSLSKSEKKAFNAVMNNHSREQVKKLYLYIRKTPRQQISNERMYEAAYEKSYQKDKDYLLRNELRLLGNELKEFLIKFEIEKELKENASLGNMWYLQALKARKLDEYYEAEYPKLYAKAEMELRFLNCLLMSEQYYKHISQSWARHLNFEIIVEQLGIYKNNIKEFTTLQVRQADMGHALCTKLSSYILTKKNQIAKFEGLTNKLEISSNNPYALALEHIALAHVTQDTEKLKHLLAALENLLICDARGADIKRWLGACYNELAICALEKNPPDYAQAAVYLEKAFEAAFLDGSNPTVIFANYLRVLGHTGQYEKVKQVFDSYAPHFSKEANYPLILTAYLEVEASLGDPDIAMGLLPQLQTKEYIGYFTYKTLLITCYMRKGMYQLAMVETNNTMQNMRENQLLPEMETVYSLLRTLIRLKGTNQPKNGALKKLSEICHSISENAMEIVFRRSVMLNWYFEMAKSIVGAADANERG